MKCAFVRLRYTLALKCEKKTISERTGSQRTFNGSNKQNKSVVMRSEEKKEKVVRLALNSSDWQTRSCSGQQMAFKIFSLPSSIANCYIPDNTQRVERDPRLNNFFSPELPGTNLPPPCCLL